MPATVPHKVLLRGEDSDSTLSIAESTMPANAAGPPLHSHAFDEAFYILDGELTFQLADERGQIPRTDDRRADSNLQPWD